MMRRNMRSYSLADLPDVQLGRSRFPSSWSHSTSFSQGELVPIAVKEVIPGGTYSLDIASLVRMATPVFPVMDNAELQIDAFYVPNRLLWTHWKEFLGDNSASHWAPDVEYEVPQLKFNTVVTQSPAYEFGATSGSLANHLYKVGLLVGPGLTVSDLPNRAYRLIWNEWYRNESFQDPVYVPGDDNDRSYNADVGDGVSYGADLLRVCRLPDYFSLATPQPQSGDPVAIPLSGLAPVVTTSDELVRNESDPLLFRNCVDGSSFGSPQALYVGSVDTSSGEITRGAQYGGQNFLTSSDSPEPVYPSNLKAELSSAVGLATISELRTAWQVQRLLEAYGRGGRRYRSILQNVFGVTVPDSTIQVPEFLGSSTCYVNMNQVVQTSETSASSPLGNVGAYSMTVDRSHLFTKSFSEHGVIMVLASVRVRHTYAQGVDAFFFRKRLYDFWHPQFSTISDQPIYSREICATGANIPFPGTTFTADSVVFGYKEPWAEMRTDLNTVSGLFTADSDGQSVLQPWTYADYLDQAEIASTGVVANDEWLKESSVNIAQTIAVPSEPQFIANFAFSIKRVLPLPVYSVPGLVDHH